MDYEALEARLAALEADLEDATIPSVPKVWWGNNRRVQAARRERILRQYEERLRAIWAKEPAGTPDSEI